MDIRAGATVAALQAGLPLDPLENRILLCHALGLTRVGLITQSDRTVTQDEAAALAALAERRLRGEPIAYIVGRREFFGLDFLVTDAVLIPRPDTELLVELALERLPQQGRVLDMGTGSGAVAVALAHTRRDAQVTALDVSSAALDVARRNAVANGVRVRLVQSDWFGAIGGERFEMVVSNPPYIAAGDVHLSQGDLRFEPAGALTDHADGLAALRAIASGAPAHLEPGGWLLMEHGYDQAAQVRGLLAERGYLDVASWRDLAGIERVSGGRASLTAQPAMTAFAKMATHPREACMRKLLAICVFSLLPLVAGAVDTAEQQARALFTADWQWRLQARPEYATAIGDHRFNHTLSDTSLAASRAALLHRRAMLQQARAIAAERLPAQDRLSLELFIHEQDEALRQLAFYPYEPQPISNQDGLHVRFAQMVAQMPFATESDYRNYLARLDAVPRHVEGLVEQMRAGMATGWVAPKATLSGVPAMLRAMRESLDSGALAEPFTRIPATISPAAREEFAAAGPAALRAKVAPALQQLEAFIRTEYLPAARDSIAASELPGGAEYYSLLVAQHTGGAQTPAEVHTLGLREVDRIRALMRGAIARTGFKGTFAQFSAFANSDKRLFYKTPDRLIARYRKIVVRAWARLPQLFAKVPAEELVVKPAALANGGAVGGAYYEEGSAARPAGLVVNAARLDARPIWETEALALHEGVPGHHLQVARAHQLAGLPAFRRHAWYPAFGEGWALYAESLGYDMGFYKDAFSAFGQLNSELLRAARMVADTGIHAMGWSREQAVDYLNANTANALADNEIEVDRYIAQPGKALAYKAGQLRIQALRARAQMVLGERFDVRQFHEAVLGHGALPLPILERQVGRWIEESLHAAPQLAQPRAASGS